MAYLQIDAVPAASARRDPGGSAAPALEEPGHPRPASQGLVLWDDSEHVATDAVQLEFFYLTYAALVAKKGEIDWRPLEKRLEAIRARKHQAIVRFHDTYVGKPSGGPEYIRKLPDYHETTAKSEGKETVFPDWSHPELARFVLEFYSKVTEKYDRDPRIAYLETGFGLWAEYHLYDGPMKLGGTFPSKEFQETFLRRLSGAFTSTPWMISIDAAAEESTPFASTRTLIDLTFGVFDDSFLCKQHAKENEPNWAFFGRERWRRAPAGGEFSYYTKGDQKDALAPKGPHGVPFETAARDFHLSFIIASDQPEHQTLDRIRAAGMTCGYRFQVTEFRSGGGRSLLTLTNTGIAPIYHDAWIAVAGRRSATSLKGLCPGETRKCAVAGEGSAVTIESDRLVPGQRIEFDADLSGK
ncbi:MAG TPA: DUF4832 domain-containing protein [Planctomycetota bacterium]|nr:DUF4832 domain-containing protein [Planctomycetota bacterium]